MAYLRWLHKSWNIFWTFIGVLVLTVALFCGAIFGLMQLQPVKDQIAIEIQERFSKNFQGVLSIGQLDGLVPFQIELNEVKIYPDSSEYSPVLETSSITASLDFLSLLQNRFVINSLKVRNPNGIIDSDSDFSLEKAFVLKPSPDLANKTNASEAPSTKGLEVIIPSVVIEDGNFVFRNALKKNNTLASGDSVQLQNLQVDLFFEYSDEQRFVDINKIQFGIPELDIPRAEIYGQIYNDARFLELNALNLRLGNSTARFSGEADGVNVLNGNILGQLSDAALTIMMDRISVEPSLITRLAPTAPILPADLRGSLAGSGTLDSLNFSKAEVSVGESFTNLNGYVANLKNIQDLRYNINLDALILGQSELASFERELNAEQITAISNTRFEGQISGNTDQTKTNITAQNIERGRIDANGLINWSDQVSIDYTFQTDSLDLGKLFDPRISATKLTLNGEIKSSSLDPLNSEGGLVIKSNAGMMDNRNFDQISILANWQSGIIRPDIRAEVNGSLITTNGIIDLKSPLPVYDLEGSAANVYLNELIQDEQMKETYADIEYDLNIRGKVWNELFGQVSLDITRAVVGSDTLGRHQIYVDFNEPEAQQRILRLTSTAFDATIMGDFQPKDLFALGRQWKTYFTQRVKEEILFEEYEIESDSVHIAENQNVSISGRLKNLALITAYYPNFPTIFSSARINSTVNVNSDRLLLNATLVDIKSKLNKFEADSLMVQVTGGFRRGLKLKDFSGLQVQINAAAVNFDYLKGKQVDLSANLNQDSLEIRSSIAQIADEASFLLNTKGNIAQDSLSLFIQDFELGADSYRWVNRGTPTVQFNSDESLTLRNFIFESDSQFVGIDGTFSNSVMDSVNYNISEVKLQRISNLVEGRLSFGGVMNGNFTTRTLTTVPTIEGVVDVEALDLDGTLFGDVHISSQYNQQLDRFDTNISVSTDSAKYPSYYANNDRHGQNFDINGHVLAPVDGDFPDADTLYQFDINFNSIDLWILPYIGPKVFAEGSGLADGSGKIWGNLDTYDFESTFNVGVEDAAYLRPNFLDTYYYAQGSLTFSRNEGFVFNDIYLIDPSGGNAILSGFYDTNDFGPTDSMRISLEMDEFQFLNSSFDPTVAFFGEAYGSSTVTISGTNLNPVLRTEQPIVISDFSEISIPLLEQTEFNEDSRFIRFVDSFDLKDVQSSSTSINNRNRVDGVPSQSEEELTFAERFTLDLQFVAYEPMTVQLIFDPVTGDIVTADGTGRVRILLEDENVSMFGRFDITGGRYQFVSGDIFTRRFELEPGGTITWEGDPANARLDLNAIYSARPDINTLSNTGARDPENAQRVPVELVLNIGGTLTSIDNNFYFRLPNTFESQQSSTLSTQLASINRDENMKLLQATNFMLMGDFIPVSSTGQTQFGENLSGSAAVLNPLLSSQVINPLLSNQVNSLLNSDLSSLDVDFNLNTYNQVDLGVALRLYNDKLILRREGQITGRQSNIGDLGATYQINRTFAVTAFHRQDLTFGTLSSTDQSQQSQDINGVGVEAKVSFNTWDEFFKRLLSPFRKLFGSKKEEQNQEEITENS